MTAPTTQALFTRNRAAIDRSQAYDLAQDACRRLSDHDRACLAQWLIDSIDDTHRSIDGEIWDMRDLKQEADGVIADIAGRLAS